LDIHQDQLDCNVELASLLHVHVWLAVSLTSTHVHCAFLQFTPRAFLSLPILSL
jgi:hypothetical protein